MHIWRQRQSVDHRWLCFNFKETGKQFYQSSIEMQDFSTADMIFDGFFFCHNFYHYKNKILLYRLQTTHYFLIIQSRYEF